MEEEFVKWFSELSNKDVAIAGGKGASLAEMYNLKIPVPPGFVVTAQTYKYFIEKTGIDDEIKEILSKLDVNDTAKLNEASKKIRKIIESAEMPKEMEDEIVEAYEILDADKDSGGDALEVLEKKEEPFVACRSSATTEDLADASFAGQQDTFLNVRGRGELLEKVKKCMSSLFTARAIYYREKKGFAHEKSYLAVVVQKMIDAAKSGVIFSQNPTGSDDSIIIEAVFGLGEGIVSGKIKPDHYVVDSDVENFKILKSEVAMKKIAIVRSKEGRTETVKLDEATGEKKVLDNYQIKTLSQYAKKLEEHYGKPQDIEFAIDKEGIYIVQSRPITTSFSGGEEEVEGDAVLSGFGASPGVGSGTVKVVRSLEELEKVEKGDVLVTEMTNPEMVVSMQKAAAIVTDEGGVTCFSEDTKVLTNKGFMTIKDASEIINSGENLILLSYDTKKMKPSWKKAISAASRKRKIIQISVSQTGRMDDNTLSLTSDHKMFVFKDRNLIKKKISQILEENQALCLLDGLPESVKVRDEKLAYVLGAILSDGHVRIQYHKIGNPRRGRVTFTQKDTVEKEDLVNTVRAYFEECFGKPFREGRLKTSSSYLRGRLIQGTVLDYMCDSLDISKRILGMTQNLDQLVLRFDKISCLNFLAGLIDGDGCFLDNRLHIYIAKENVLQGVILACLNLGMVPQVTKNRNIHHVQILEKIQDILKFTRRIKGEVTEKVFGTKLFSARQILSDIAEEVNFKGRIKPYVKGNLLIDSRKILRDVLQLATEERRKELIGVLNSSLRMHRAKKICDAGEAEVYNLEIESDNELDHNFVVFTKKYTPLLVSNSHAAIVSREMGIPAVVGTGDATSKLKDGDVVTVDGQAGKVFMGKGETKKVEIKPVVPTKTEIKVIVDLPAAAGRAAKSGAKGIGLMRLEGIIAGGGKHPLKFVEDGKTGEYVKLISEGIRKIVEKFEGVWIRTSDIRTDEFRELEGAPQEVEGNPMLGDHGVRFSLKHKEIMKAELMAVKEAAEHFPDKKFGIMMPQIISVSEVQETKKLAQEVGIPKNIEIGIMVETPAAVQIIEDLCSEGIAFISFGTNDLTQYTLAVDRNNEEVQNLFDETHPAVVASIRRVIQICKKHRVKTSICGQAGSKPEMVKILLAEGIDSISVNADAALEISELVRGLEGGVVGEGDLINDKTEDKRGYGAAVGGDREAVEKAGEVAVPQKMSDIFDDTDMEDLVLKELEGGEDYVSSNPNGDSKKDIPVLNEAIPINSESFSDEELDLPGPMPLEPVLDEPEKSVPEPDSAPEIPPEDEMELSDEVGGEWEGEK